MAADLKDIVIANLREFEGDKHFMYLDHLGKVTIGIGKFIPDVKAVEALFPDPPAAKAAAIKCFNDVKKAGKQKMSKYEEIFKGHGLSWNSTRSETELAASLAIAMKDAKAYFPDLDKLPIEAQVAVIDISFQCGLGGLKKFKNLKAALEKRDYAKAAKESFRPQAQKSRNDTIRDCFLRLDNTLTISLAAPTNPVTFTRSISVDLLVETEMKTYEWRFEQSKLITDDIPIGITCCRFVDAKQTALSGILINQASVIEFHPLSSGAYTPIKTPPGLWEKVYEELRKKDKAWYTSILGPTLKAFAVANTASLPITVVACSVGAIGLCVAQVTNYAVDFTITAMEKMVEKLAAEGTLNKSETATLKRVLAAATVGTSLSPGTANRIALIFVLLEVVVEDDEYKLVFKLLGNLTKKSGVAIEISKLP